jgi:hypothetical protein
LAILDLDRINDGSFAIGDSGIIPTWLNTTNQVSNCFTQDKKKVWLATGFIGWVA